MSVQVGDAVLKFLGDSTNLDQQLDQVGPKAKAAFNEGAEAAEDAGERMKFSMAEARGEVRLLGEEVGVRLPRHVGNFLAQLPGVGPAMSAAFSATAVLFLAQALVQLADKGSKLIADTFIFTKSMKDQNAAVAEMNKTFLEQAQHLAAVNQELEDFGLTKGELLQQKIKQFTDTIAASNEEMKKQQQIMSFGKSVMGDAAAETEQFANAQSAYIKAQHDATEADRERLLAQKQLDQLTKDESIKTALENIENAKKIAVASAETEEAKYLTTIRFEQQRLAVLRSAGAQELSQAKALATEIEVQQEQHAQKMANELDAWNAQIARIMAAARSEMLRPMQGLTGFTDPFQKLEDSAAKLGVTLKSSLQEQLTEASTALKQLAETGKATDEELKMGAAHVEELQKALDNFGKSESQFLEKTKAWKQFTQELDSSKTALQQWAVLGTQALDGITKSLQGAFQAIVLGQGNVAKELEKAVASQLAAVASQAAIKALYYTAEGFAALASFEEGSAAQFFTAAGEMAAVAVSAGAAGRLMNGASGSSSSGTQAGHTTQSNTSSQAGGTQSISGVQAFATGGLVPSTTLAMIGEQGPEAVIPLTDPTAMRAIGESIAAASNGGGHHLHVNVEGMISADNLAKVVKRLNGMVDRGQVYLRASDSLRITKRSA